MPTKYQLTNALFSGGPLKTTNANFKIVNGVQREDGSGKSFNVTGVDQGGRTVTVHVRTLD